MIFIHIASKSQMLAGVGGFLVQPSFPAFAAPVTFLHTSDTFFRANYINPAPLWKRHDHSEKNRGTQNCLLCRMTGAIKPKIITIYLLIVNNKGT